MEDLSFVVQGKIHACTKICIESIRKHYPKSKIILSTWEGEYADNLEYDIILKNKDPGAIEYSKGNYNNTNRQILSTHSGLRAVKTKYAVKIRTDTEILDKKLPNLLENLKSGILFKKKIIGLNLFFRNPKEYPLLFHIGDIFQAGINSDLLNLWDIPLAPEPETSTWCIKNFYILNEYQSLPPRYTPEQYIFISFLNKNGIKASLKFCCEMTSRLAHASENYIAQNFTIFSSEQLGLKIIDKFNQKEVAKYLYSNDYLEKVALGEIKNKQLDSHIKKRNIKLIIRFLKNPLAWLSFIKLNQLFKPHS